MKSLRDPKRRPTHPGAILRAKFMEHQARANIATGEARREDPHRCAHDFNCRGECFR